jgi:hypothetical protein
MMNDKTINHRDTETQRKSRREKTQTFLIVFVFLSFVFPLCLCVSVVNGFFRSSDQKMTRKMKARIAPEKSIGSSPKKNRQTRGCLSSSGSFSRREHRGEAVDEKRRQTAQQGAAHDDDQERSHERAEMDPCPEEDKKTCHEGHGSESVFAVERIFNVGENILFRAHTDKYKRGTEMASEFGLSITVGAAVGSAVAAFGSLKDQT